MLNIVKKILANTRITYERRNVMGAWGGGK